MSEDPRTLAALDKIRAILVEYDLWGCVTVCDTERTHWMHQLSPSWSCLTFDPETGAVRVRAKRADFASKEGHHFVVEHTVGAVFNTRDYAALLFKQMETVAQVLDKQGLGIVHTPYQDMRPKKE
jgi:hypothetical protein